MSNLRLPYYLAVSALTLSVACALGAVGHAKGPAPDPDFTISIETQGWDWADLQRPAGTFNSAGAVSDVGNVYYSDSHLDGSGNLWHLCVFVGEFGSFEADLPAWPQNHGEYPFELTDGTGDYASVSASGTTTARTREGFFWYEDDMTLKKFKWTYLDVSWTASGFLNP